MKAKKYQILLLEDDLSLGKTLDERLQEEGFAVSWFRSVATAKAAITSRASPPHRGSFDLFILDIGLPDGSGLDIAEILGPQADLPILFLTAQNDPETRLKSYEKGAAEFIPKPFHLKELLIRIQHVLKEHALPQIKEVHGIKVHLSEGFLVNQSGEHVFPSATELKILKLLIESSPEPVSRDMIMTTLWGEAKEANTRSVDNLILKVRQILGPHGDSMIRTVRGIGYQWFEGKRED